MLCRCILLGTAVIFYSYVQIGKALKSLSQFNLSAVNFQLKNLTKYHI